MRQRSLSEHGGLLIDAPPGALIEELDRDRVGECFMTAGLLLLRGFPLDDARFYAFGRLFADRFLIDPLPGRISQRVAAEVQTVTPGDGAVNFHYEYGIVPFRPDVIWFYCANPALQGGQTIVCDGVKLWRSLSGSTRDLFSTRRVEYKTDLAPKIWRTFFHIEDEASEAARKLHRALGRFEGLDYRVDQATQVLSMRYRALAVGRTRYGVEPCFTGSILPGVYPSFPPACFEGGIEIHADVLREIERAAAACTVKLDWQPGDVAMIDNTRWMHGRCAFIGEEQRRVLNLTAYTSLTRKFTRAAAEQSNAPVAARAEPNKNS